MATSSAPFVIMATDSPRRDVEWRLFLAAQLAKEGIRSVVGRNFLVRRQIGRFRNGAFLGRLPSNAGRRLADQQYLQKLREQNIHFFFLHDEGAFFDDKYYEETVRQIYPVEYLSDGRLAAMFCWGEAQRQYLLQHLPPEKAESVHVTGAPRMDLCKEANAGLDEDRTRRLRERYGDFILVAGRFTRANCGASQAHPLGPLARQVLSESGWRDGFDDEGLSRILIGRWSRIMHEFAEFLPCIVDLSKAFPECNIVVRPHPAERQETYELALEPFSNVFIDREGDIRPYLRACKCFVQSECTTGVEAEIMGVPHVNFMPGGTIFDEFSPRGLRETGLPAQTREEVVRGVRSLLRGDRKTRSVHSALEALLWNIKPEASSSVRVVSILRQHFRRCGLLGQISHPSARERLSAVRHEVVPELVGGAKRALNGAVDRTLDGKHYRYSRASLFNIWSSFGGAAEDFSLSAGLAVLGPQEAN